MELYPAETVDCPEHEGRGAGPDVSLWGKIFSLSGLWFLIWEWDVKGCIWGMRFRANVFVGGFCTSGERCYERGFFIWSTGMDGYVLAASIMECHHHIENWVRGIEKCMRYPLFHRAEFLFAIGGLLMKLWGFG